MRALADPLRARAWVELAQREADRNPAGYFRAGFDSGEWPSARADAPAAKRWRWIEETSVTLELDDAHAIVDDWRDLDDVERSLMHERVDAVRATAAETADGKQATA